MDIEVSRIGIRTLLGVDDEQRCKEYLVNTSKKAALVTGASHGIGRELAIKLVSEGWHVFGTGRDLDSLKKMEVSYPLFQAIQGDFTRNEDLKKVAETVLDSRLPLFLNVQNAGMKSPPKNLNLYTCEAVDEVMQVNLLAPMKLTALLARYMPPQGRILYVTSRAATLKLRESSTYCASKAGIDVVTGIVRQELEDRQIGVLNVIPGEVDTTIQKILRETKTFHLHDLFIKAKDMGGLIAPSICAEFLKWLLCDLPFDKYKNAKMPISIYDDWHHEYWLKKSEDLPPFPFT